MRSRAKPRPRGSACVGGRRCVAQFDYVVLDANGEERVLRFCPKHMADRMMGDHVKAQEGRCRRCGSTFDLQWAHVHSRRYLAIRWDRDNSMALCRGDHMYFTNRPLEWEQWCRSTGTPWDVLRDRALTRQPMDPMTVIEGLGGGTYGDTAAGAAAV